MKRKNNVIMREIGGQTLLVPIGAKVIALNGLITLNEPAACLWEMLAQERTEDELSAALAERFDVTLERAYKDVQTFLKDIDKIGVIEW
jgi:hypothetical protein